MEGGRRGRRKACGPCAHAPAQACSAATDGGRLTDSETAAQTCRPASPRTSFTRRTPRVVSRSARHAPNAGHRPIPRAPRASNSVCRAELTSPMYLDALDSAWRLFPRVLSPVRGSWSQKRRRTALFRFAMRSSTGSVVRALSRMVHSSSGVQARLRNSNTCFELMSELSCWRRVAWRTRTRMVSAGRTYKGLSYSKFMGDYF